MTGTKLTGSWLRAATLIGLLSICNGLHAQLTETSQGFSVASGRQEFYVNPGDSFSGTLPVNNLLAEPQVIRAYIGDWVRVAGQTSGYSFEDDTGIEPRSLAKWTVISPDQLALEPNETRDIRFEVNLPDDPTMEGSYWCAIFVENVPTRAPATGVEGIEGMQVGIGISFRYAIQVYATIAGTEIRDVTYNSLNISQTDEGLDAIAVIENRGNIYMRPKVWLELRNTAGETVYRLDHVEQTLLPESARDYVFKVTGLSVGPGRYLAMIITDYGVPTLIAAQQMLDLRVSNSGGTEEGEGSGGG
jgi:hypothetical protein